LLGLGLGRTALHLTWFRLGFSKKKTLFASLFEPFFLLHSNKYSARSLRPLSKKKGLDKTSVGQLVVLVDRPVLTTF
jgi:hypothetical protein